MIKLKQLAGLAQIRGGQKDHHVPVKKSFIIF
jgi:hypothetical protein